MIAELLGIEPRRDAGVAAEVGEADGQRHDVRAPTGSSRCTGVRSPRRGGGATCRSRRRRRGNSSATDVRYVRATSTSCWSATSGASMCRAHQRDLGLGDLRGRGAERADELQRRLLADEVARDAEQLEQRDVGVAEPPFERARIRETRPPATPAARTPTSTPARSAVSRERDARARAAGCAGTRPC